MSGERPAGRLVLRWHHVAPLVLALVLGGSWAAWKAWSDRPVEEPVVETPPPPPEEPPGPPQASAEEIDFPTLPVTLYWPSADGSGLLAREAEIFATQRTTDRLKQVVELLTRGPEAAKDPGVDESSAASESTEPAADAQLVAPLPEGTRLRAVFLDGEGTAYVSLSEQLVSGAPGGSAWELTAVYSIVNSLVRSFDEVRRVQLLVEGRDVESIGGHLDARRPFAFNERVVAEDRAAP